MLAKPRHIPVYMSRTTVSECSAPNSENSFSGDYSVAEPGSPRTERVINPEASVQVRRNAGRRDSAEPDPASR